MPKTTTQSPLSPLIDLPERLVALGYDTAVEKRRKPDPIIIGLSFAVSLIFAIFMCLKIVGEESILAHASKHKPYSVLLAEQYYRDFQSNADCKRIICFGDSNSFHPPDVIVPKSDTFAVHMPGLIREAMKGSGTQSVPVFSEWAFAGASMFDYYCLFYQAVDLSPDLIIVPINWRTFGQNWLENSDWLHPELSAFVPVMEHLPAGFQSPVRSREISLIKQIESKVYLHRIYIVGMKACVTTNLQSLLSASAGKSESTEVTAFENNGDRQDRKAIDGRHNFQVAKRMIGFEAEPPLEHLFPMEIEENNPTYQSLRSLVHIASERGVPVLFYIWPLDKKRLAEAGMLDETSFANSKNSIAEAVRAKNSYFVDLSDLLEHRYFSDVKGHCKISGRRKIAEALLPEIIAIIGERKATDN